jgi:hypothetical protein
MRNKNGINLKTSFLMIFITPAGKVPALPALAEEGWGGIHNS